MISRPYLGKGGVKVVDIVINTIIGDPTKLSNVPVNSLDKLLPVLGIEFEE